MFFLDTKSTYLDLLSPNSFKPRKKYPWISKHSGDRKSDYLEMRRTYAQ